MDATPYNNAVNRKVALFRVGLLIYAISFALVATVGPWTNHPNTPGYGAAFIALVAPLIANPFSTLYLHDETRSYVALLISGWINPLFLITLILAHLRHERAVAILKFIVLLMIPFCWVVFYEIGAYPREGHFLWLFGMVLALFSIDMS